MWIFSTLGFFSCTRSAEDFETFQIRARVRGDLENLIHEMGLQVRVLETPNADYRYRLLVDQATFRAIVAELVERVNYSNFKNEVHDTPGQESKAGPYLRVWSAMASLQDGKHGHVPAEYTLKRTPFLDDDPPHAAGIALNETFPGFEPKTPAAAVAAKALENPAEEKAPARPKRKSFEHMKDVLSTQEVLENAKRSHKAAKAGKGAK